jgi:hypothetical protein
MHPMPSESAEASGFIPMPRYLDPLKDLMALY